MSVEGDKVEDINYEDIHYGREDEDFQIMSRENSGTGVDQLKLNMEGKSYKSVSKKLQFLINNNTCMKKQIHEIMK